jgi:hypothetical protein
LLASYCAIILQSGNAYSNRNGITIIALTLAMQLSIANARGLMS